MKGKIMTKGQKNPFLPPLDYATLKRLITQDCWDGDWDQDWREWAENNLDKLVRLLGEIKKWPESENNGSDIIDFVYSKIDFAEYSLIDCYWCGKEILVTGNNRYCDQKCFDDHLAERRG